MRRKNKRLPLVQVLVDYLKEHAGVYIHGGQMERVAQSWGYEAETGKRRMRELTQKSHPSYNPKIKEKYIDGFILYSWMEK